MDLSHEAAREIRSRMNAEGVAPEGGLRVDVLADQPAGDAVAIRASVSAMATETDTIISDGDTGARVFLDQAGADVIGKRTLTVDSDSGRFVLS